METKLSNTKVAKKTISVLLTVLMVMSCITVAFPTIASAAATTQQINNLTAALNAFVNSGETGSYSVSGSITSGNYVVADNTSQGYVYNVAVTMAPVFAGEMSTAADSGNNWYTLMRSRIKSLTGHSSGAGATLIDNLLPVFNNRDRTNKERKSGALSRPDPWLTHYGSLRVTVTRTVSAAMLSYDSLDDVPSTLPVSYHMTTSSGEGNSTGGGFLNYWREQWYYFGSALSYGVLSNDTTTVPVIKNAFNYFSPALVGKTTYDMTVEYNASTIATLISNNNSNFNVVNGLSTAIKNKFFTNPTVTEISAFMGRAVVAQQVISLLPVNTWYLNAIANGYDPQNYSQMTSLYSTAVPYYNSLNGASADAKSVLTANYSMNLNAFNAWKEQLFDDIQIYELRALKETIDQKVDELYQYVVPEEEREASFPHLIYGNATEAYTNLQLDVAAGQFAGWLTAINGYKPANVSAVFTEGLGYIQGAQALVNYEIQVRHYESVFASYVEYFTALFNKDLTAIQSEYLMETMYPTVVSSRQLSLFSTTTLSLQSVGSSRQSIRNI